MIPRQRTTDITLTPNARTYWRNGVDPLTDSIQRYWLRRPGALTVGLRGLGTLKLRVLRQSIGMPTPDECHAMQLNKSQPARVREICLSVDGRDCVVARSVVSLKGWSGSWKAIRGLGRRPLADLLYDDRRVTRSSFETAGICLPHPLGKLVLLSNNDLTRSSYAAQYARRSVFWRGEQPLLVAECFLPAFWEIARQASSPSG